MAERFVSPGVYTQERDFSYYVASVGTPALGLVGETEKGPAFIPTLVKSMGEFREIFGGLNTDMHVPYAANSWFKYADQAVVVRVLGQEDVWEEGTDTVIYLTASGGTGGGDDGTGEYVFAVLVGSGVTACTIQTGVAFQTTSFGFTASSPTLTYNSTNSGNITVASQSAQNYIGNTFSATTGSLASQLMKIVDVSNGLEIFTGTPVTMSAHVSTITSDAHPFAVNGFAAAQTPMIVSDIAAAGQDATNLFTIYTRAMGNAANRDIKIAIENITTGTNKTFDIVVREWNDQDSRQVVLERFTKLTMTKTGQTYIARQIGDSLSGTGEFDPVSKYIYVEVEAGDHHGRVPAGFRGVRVPSFRGAQFPNFPFTTGYSSSVAASRQYLGVNWGSLKKDHLMYNDYAQWDLSQTTGTIVLSGFHIDSGASATPGFQVGESGLTEYTQAKAKFIVPVLGGRDGWKRTSGPRKLLEASPTTLQEDSWKDAIDALANPEEWDINVLAVPGVSIANAIGTYAKEMVEDRADALYIGDSPENNSTATAAVNAVSTIDSNYAATYWPYVKIYDTDNEAFVWIPPTPQVLEAIAYTDQVAYPWWAAAGLNRGLLTDVVKAEFRLTQAERDELYEGKVNPVATFPGQGIALWGQKTLQTRSTALDRINVRRMLLYVRKVIAGAAKYVVFEPNDEATRDRLQAIIQPVLDLVRIKRGLEDFRIIIDETVNTPDVIDRGQIVAQIFIKPTKAAETIVLYFNLTPQGVTFEE